MDSNLFFELLQLSFGNRETLSRVPTSKEWYAIYEESERQSIIGIMLKGLESLPQDQKPPKDLLLHWIGLGQMVEQHGKLVNEGVVSIKRLFETRKIQYIVVKGQAVASYYSEPLRRQPGDVDYYCDKANFDKSIKVVQECWGVEPKQGGSNKHVHYEKNGVTFEGHFLLTTLYNKKKDAYWDKILVEDEGAKVVIDNDVVRTLSPTLHVLFIFLHLFHHLLELGVGLRQFCDMAVMLHHCHSEIDFETLRKHLNAFGLEKAYRACGSLLVYNLGLTEHELGYVLTANDRLYGDRMLDIVMYRGNMGHYNKWDGFSGVKHKLEAVGIKLIHFWKFGLLAPGYSCNWLWSEFWRKI